MQIRRRIMQCFQMVQVTNNKFDYASSVRLRQMDSLIRRDQVKKLQAKGSSRFPRLRPGPKDNK